MVGFSTGFIEVLICQPLLYCKNATQQGLPLTLDPRVLYRGLAISLSATAILTSLQMPLTGAVRTAFTGGKVRSLSDFEVVASAAVGGAISGIVNAPMELIIIQQQRFGISLGGTGAKVLGELGMTGMLRGVMMTCGREGIFTAGYMGVAPVLQQKIKKQFPDTSIATAKVGGAICAGLIAGTLSHPLDTIKTCMQGDLGRETYGTVTQTAKTLFKDGGIKRFYTGFAWRTGRMIFSIGIMDECRNFLAPMFFPTHFE
eukprot:CAMPEP_0114352950 /NCGR_PEP_ID=MMETSP0101-20121206/18315_1 /TAXON_ID=38822 ORGANISM="Pteridomonas danica, Strain PT" /NCGR_SAMPLE_ID=MMETSP0101 /ASSEMBLY_ACC=CAM_ASM_000211 /LENGTH=257 /DNA_ID=CAMNT_0001493577 /DNA_START=8 /DNA_END=781 /DNA_ORIENTATION=+